MKKVADWAARDPFSRIYGTAAPLAPLSTRCRTALLAVGLDDRAKVAKAFADGSIRHVEDFGKKAHAEVAEWLAAERR